MQLQKEELLQYFQDILKLEQGARSLYEGYLRKIEDEKVKKTLREILKDEILHIGIARELVEILEG